MLRFSVEGERDLLISWDPDARAAYIKVAQGRVAKTSERAPGVFVDLAANGRLLGIEILDPRRLQISLFQRIVRQFNVPSLQKVNPHAIPSIFAHA